jgi:hypothetical protein
MDTENDQFENVRKLLALKRHEQPPPRYFHDFSSKVIARLQALEAARPVSWRQRLGLDFDFRPAMMGAFGVVACAVLLIGVITSLGVSQPTSPTFAVAGDPSSLFASPTVDPVFAGGASLNPTVKPEEIPASTVPVSGSLGSSPFGLMAPHAERAAFTFSPEN